MSSSRAKRSARPSHGDMRYTPFEDDRGYRHEPVDHSKTYVPSDDEDDGPIPSLLSSKRRKMMDPSVSVRGRRGDSVEIRIPARTTPNTGTEGRSILSQKAQGKRPVTSQPSRSSFKGSRSSSRSNEPTEQEEPSPTVEKAQQSGSKEFNNPLKIQYVTTPHRTSRGTDYYMEFSAKNLPKETRKVAFEKITQHMRLYKRWVGLTPVERQSAYKNKFGKFLQLKLK